MSRYSSMVNQYFAMMKEIPYIAQNPQYKFKAGNTRIHVIEQPVVNAYASTDEDGRHRIAMYEGLLDASAFLGVMLAAWDSNGDLIQLRDACNHVGRAARQGYAREASEKAEKLFGYDKLTENMAFRSRAESYLGGCMLSVIAHEQGHICLDHTVRGDIDYPVSQGDERMADQFSQSVIASLPYKETNVSGALFTEILFTWMSKEHSGPATTHPKSRERVFNTWRSHEEFFMSLGLDEQTLGYFLPV